ncbi:MAG TPA: Stf0 family sulfotransferase [Bauldia sp.]|nr:Stf0 family sulfotransferase [Bauldia sp.]
MVDRHAEEIERQVWQLYLALLGRPPDPSGLDYFSKALRSGRSLRDIVEGIVASVEFRDRAFRLAEEFTMPEIEPEDAGSSGFAARQAQVTTRSRELLRERVVTPFPPAATGVATATRRTFIARTRGVDFFGMFESRRLLDAANADPELSDAGHRVFHHSVLEDALRRVPYQAVVVSFGNSPHNVPAVQWLLRLGGMFRGPIVAYVHDPIVLEVLRRASSAAGFRPDELFRRAYGRAPLADFQRRHHRALVDRGITGMRAISRAARIDHVIVNSQAAKQMLRRDDPEFAGDRIARLFHPVFPVSVSPPVPSSDPARPMRIGCFGVATDSKRLDVVLAAVKVLRARGRDVRLTVAGYDTARIGPVIRHEAGGFLEIHDNPDDRRFVELLAAVDVAVQLRGINGGETSGVVSMLMALGKPVIVTRIGAFKEFGEAVRFVEASASPADVADAILGAVGEAEALGRAAKTFAARHSPQRFCERLDELIADAPGTAAIKRPSGNAGPPADWSSPDKTCIIAFTPRTGSTYLAHLMRTTQRLGMPAEFFNLGFAAKAYPEAEGDIRKLCRVAATKGRSSNGVVSFKLLPEHFDAIQQHIRLTDWFPDPSFVRVRRRDRLGQAISLAIAAKTDVWDSRFRNNRVPAFEVAAIDATLRRIASDEARWDLYFARNGIDPLTLWYEDFEADPVSAVRAIAGSLGLDEPIVVDVAAVELKRQRNEMNEEWRARFLHEAASRDRLDRMDVRPRRVS